GVAGQDRLLVGLTTIDDNPFRTAMPLERLAQEPLGRSQIPPLTEPELNRIAVAVDGAVEIHPMPTDLDISLVDMPSAGDRALAPIELLQQERSIVDGPAMDGGVVDGDAALRHHLLEIAQAQAVSEIPADAEQDQRAIEMAAFEHLAPPERAGGVRRTELPKSLQQIPLNRTPLPRPKVAEGL